VRRQSEFLLSGHGLSAPTASDRSGFLILCGRALVRRLGSAFLGL
jgi:hypothetical protein